MYRMQTAMPDSKESKRNYVQTQTSILETLITACAVESVSPIIFWSLNASMVLQAMQEQNGKDGHISLVINHIGTVGNLFQSVGPNARSSR